MKEKENKKDYLYLGFLGLFSFFLLIPGSNGFALLKQGDEFMHFHSVYETLERNEFWIPILSGVPNPYKPPLLFWFSQFFILLLGKSVLIARLPSILSGVGTVVLLFRFMRRFNLSIHVAFFWSLLYLTTLGFFKFSRLLMMEQTLTFLTALSIYFLIKKQGVYSGIIAGIGYLLKGPILLVYILLFFFVFGSVTLFRFQFKPYIWKGKKFALPLIRLFLFFISSFLLLPFVYYAFLYIQHSGLDLIRFFFIVENIGKFQGDNQSAINLIFGIIIYTLPWTVFLFYGIKVVILKKMYNSNGLYSRIFLLTGFLLLLVHILPNRKDPYYVIPVIPFLFLSVSITFKNIKEIPPHILKLSLGFILILYLFLIVVLHIIGLFFNHISFYFEALSIGLIIIGLKSKLSLLSKNILFGFYIIIFFQFLFLPIVYLPLIPNEHKEYLSKNICVISQNPWDLFEIEILLPDSNLKHASSKYLESCPHNYSGFLSFDDSINFSDKFIHKIKWNIWKPHIIFSELNIYHFQLKNLQKEINYYELQK